MVVAALDQHEGYKGPQLTGMTRLFWISWKNPIIYRGHYIPIHFLMSWIPPPSPSPQAWAACVHKAKPKMDVSEIEVVPGEDKNMK